MKPCPAAQCAVLFTLAMSAGCDAVERVRTRFGNTTTDTVVTATGSGLTLGLQVPPTLRPGDEGVLRISLANLTDTAVSNVRLELTVPGWAEPMPPRIGDRPVSMSALGDGSTLFTYRMDDAPLAPKQQQTVQQRIRMPVFGQALRGANVFTRSVRARLLTGNDQPLAQVEAELAVDSAALAASRTGSAPDTSWRDQLGALQLGMTVADAKRAVPNGRDTTWSQEGARQRGLLLPVANGTALAVVNRDAVVRIEVADPAIRTAERLGVGSSMKQLRAAYGAPCADASAGRVVVWFAKAPGITFAINSPVPPNAAQLRERPDEIPNTAQVTRWWLSRDADICSR